MWLLTLLTLTIFNLYQLRRLNRWLLSASTENNIDPPNSFGLWGNIFDIIYRTLKQEKKSSYLLGIILGKAQESTAILEAAVMMADKHGNLEWWNLSSEKLLGFKKSQDRNQPITNLINDPQFYEYFYSEKYDETLRIESPTNPQRIIEYQIALFGESQRIIIARDVTQIQRLENMRKDFVGSVSHELSTPITVFKGYLETIIDNTKDLDPKWEKPMLQMKQQAHRMENVVRDLLVLSALETKTLPKLQEKINISTLINEIEADTQQMFLEKSHQFSSDCDESVLITGKRSELYSTISNLVVNAAKYTPHYGKIELFAKLSEESFNISVQDNGIGIEPQHLPRLTERFYRVDISRSSETGGTGLGLAIVKHILMRHDADLEISSETGKGSLFICKLPLARVSQLSNKDEDQYNLVLESNH
jgi:two-component system phosphate regulon sensor histidine kinase PhoR|tara:strand:+ start:238 stop:1497 length:1260 start_codon:yes stop_codon:yes gene_type:complete